MKIGDIVEYKTAIGTKTYQVTFVGSISYTDYSYLNEMGDNRITLITCIAILHNEYKYFGIYRRSQLRLSAASLSGIEASGACPLFQ